MSGGALGVRFAANEAIPDDQGLIAWNFDPALATVSQLTVAGDLNLAAITLRRPTPVSKLWYAAGAAGATPTAGQNFVCLYDANGNLLTSASADGLVTSSNGPASLVVPTVTCPAARYYVGILFNAATNPTIVRAGGLFAGTNNANTSGATLRFAKSGTAGLTALPTPNVMSANGNGPAFWAAVS